MANDGLDLDIDWESATPDDLDDEFGEIIDRAAVSQLSAMKALGMKTEADTKRNIVSNGQVDTGNMLNSVESRTRRTMRGGIETRVVVPVQYAIWQEILHHSFLRQAVEENNAVAKQLLGVTMLDPFEEISL